MGAVLLEAFHVQGVERLNAFVAQFPQWDQLSSKDLELYGPGFTLGWELPGLCHDLSVRLRILVGPAFPFKPLRIAVCPAPAALFRPNVEKHGLLCLLSEGWSCSSERISSVAKELLTNARDLVDGWGTGAELERFEDEFESYWEQWSQIGKGFIISLCTIGGKSRWVYAAGGKSFTVVAENEQVLRSWLTNFYTLQSSAVKVRTIPLVRLSRPPRPEEYPSLVSGFLRLLDHDTEARAMVEKHIRLHPDVSKDVLLSFDGRRGSGFAGLVLPRNAKNMDHGFRVGHVPPEVLLQRYGAQQVIGATVTRCDPAWVHGRDHNPSVATFVGKTVVILGVGSLGSGVTELLAKMGVGKLVLVDPEQLESENTSRHSLGARSMFLSKASDFGNELLTRFPHLQIDTHYDRWELCCHRDPDFFSKADLVISTIGGWAAESSLNALAVSSEKFPPVLFGWLEEHAAAGHAVAFFWGNGGCLRCLTDDKGLPSVPVTKWPDGGTQKLVPMCGGTFQPYGATELTFSQGLVADLAADILLGEVHSAHRVWIGQEKLLRPGGGEWHPEWIRLHGHPGIGGKIVEIAVDGEAACPVCGVSGEL